MDRSSESGRYVVGVDTGGTYTDAAVIEAQTHRVVAAAKALTTKGDLAIGVGQAISDAIAGLPRGLAPRDVALVSISTTLATNAVVEGHGSPVAAVLIGFDAAMAGRTGILKAFPGLPLALIAGGHDHTGEALAPLDLSRLETFLDRVADRVDAFAVAGTFAVRNPAHELAVRAAIVERTGKPVTLSQELSSALDAPRRALTATLNARLIARISRLIEAVARALKGLGIACPLMIVKGDGTLALAAAVATRPIETVLSGPAASLVGARSLSGLDSFIMADMGGTTTDVGLILDGRPQVAPHGASVGGWRTMVKAIEVRTLGLGSDSEVAFGADGRLKIGPGRIVPVSLIAARYPELIAMLEADLAETEGGSLHARFALRPFGSAPTPPASELSPREQAMLDLVTERPIGLRKLAVSSGAQRALAGLQRKGLVQLVGFTPSDAAHVLALQDTWSRPAAVLAARLLVRGRDMKAGTDERIEAFAREVWSETARRSARVVLEAALGLEVGADPLAEAVCAGSARLGFARVAITPSLPVVAVGGPVKVFYGEVGRRLGCDIVFAPYCEVANAVGAAAGVIAKSVAVTIDGDGGGLFRVHGPKGTRSFADAAAALAGAESLARAEALAAVRAMGAQEPDIRVSVEKHLLPEARDDSGLVQAVVTVEAIGRPAMQPFAP